jgi:hypothetical protein
MDSRLPSELKERKSRAGHRQEQAKPQIAQTIEALCQSPGGVAFLRDLCCRCGFNKPSISIDKMGRVSSEVMIYKEALRNLYISYRQYFPRAALIEIELGDKESK